MTTTMALLSVFFIYTMMGAKNLLKLSLTLLMVSSLIFFRIALICGSTWMPTIFFLLFMGGILVLFILISSILPNERMNKSYLSKSVLMVGTVWVFLDSQSVDASRFSETLKTLLESSNNLSWAVILMGRYFMVLLLSLCKKERPLRTYLCHNEDNLVNC